MLHLHPIDAASTATSQLDRNRRQFRTANTFHAGWSRPAVPASVSRFSSCCRAPRRLRAEGTTRSLRCGGAEDGHPSQDSSTASPSETWGPTYSYSYTMAPTMAPTTDTMSPTATEAPTRTETYAPSRVTEAPSYAPTTDTYAPTGAPTAP